MLNTCFFGVSAMWNENRDTFGLVLRHKRITNYLKAGFFVQIFANTIRKLLINRIAAQWDNERRETPKLQAGTIDIIGY